MSKHFHIITCDDEKTLVKFINDGKVGIRPVIKENISSGKNFERNLKSMIRMNWDILADIARVKKGDYVLLHAKGIIQGVFKVISNPRIERSHAQYFNGPNIYINNWKNNWRNIKTIISKNQYIWWVPIQPVNNLFFEKIDMDIIFRQIAKGEITSLPQRLRYEDKNKTVKGVTEADFNIIVHLFYNYSSHVTPPNRTPSSLQNPQSINFNYLTDDGYEKNLEAIIVHRVRSNRMRINGLNFSHTNILNTVPLGYLKIADILTWSVKDKVVNPWIWELKKEEIKDIYDVKSKSGRIIREGLLDIIKRLNNRASFLTDILENGYKITGIILAKGFLSDVIRAFRNIITPVGLLEEIILISYSGTGRNVTFEFIARNQ